MKIGIISDTHDNQSNLETCLDYFRQHNIDTVFHCGDLISTGMINLFAGFKLIYVYGNCDLDNAELYKSVMKLSKDNFASPIYTGKLDGKLILAMHGHVEGSLMEAIQSRHYDYVFTGHSHMRGDRMHFKTRVINSGALGGLKREKRSFCILDLTTDHLDFVHIPDL
ncbi:MAG: YfcE family phosphodiesterase [Anaerolineaceae bacterium]|nr:YfcE family phosphodiesterase [Anaerolineaceae bacterium]